MAFFGFTLGGAGASGSVATAVAAGAAALDAAAAGADAGVAGGFAAGAGVVAGAFATGAAGVSVDEVAAAGAPAGGAEAGVAGDFAGACGLRRSFRCVFVWHQFAPLFMCVNRAASNAATPRNQAASAALADHRLKPALPTWRKQRFNHAACCCGKILGVTIPPRFRKSRQPVYVHVFYLNHFEQSKARMRASPTAPAGAAMRRFGNAVVARDVVDHHGAGANSRSEFPAAARVACPDAGAQAEWRIVRESDGFVGGRDRTNREHGAECFFAHELHRVVHVV